MQISFFDLTMLTIFHLSISSYNLDNSQAGLGIGAIVFLWICGRIGGWWGGSSNRTTRSSSNEMPSDRAGL